MSHDVFQFLTALTVVVGIWLQQRMAKKIRATAHQAADAAQEAVNTAAETAVATREIKKTVGTTNAKLAANDTKLEQIHDMVNGGHLQALAANVTLARRIFDLTGSEQDRQALQKSQQMQRDFQEKT